MSLNSCGLFDERIDPVISGGLSLTPLIIPEGMQAPRVHDLLIVPDMEGLDGGVIGTRSEAPLPLDLEEASAEALSLHSDVDTSKSKSKITIAAELKQTVGGHGFLKVDADFEKMWEHMNKVVIGLGFKISDHNRSNQTYHIFREVPKSLAQIDDEKLTGVERDIANKEQYQIYINKKNKDTTEISIRNSQGQADMSALARHLLVQVKAFLEQPLK